MVMRKHQRYFPVYDSGDELQPVFVTVANGPIDKDLVRVSYTPDEFSMNSTETSCWPLVAARDQLMMHRIGSTVRNSCRRSCVCLPCVLCLSCHSNTIFVNMSDNMINFDYIPDARHLIVQAGNEAVLQARFEDAQFFFEEDLKKLLADFRPQLAGITFQKALGTMLDKSVRLIHQETRSNQKGAFHVRQHASRVRGARQHARNEGAGAVCQDGSVHAAGTSCTRHVLLSTLPQAGRRCGVLFRAEIRFKPSQG